MIKWLSCHIKVTSRNTARQEQSLSVYRWRYSISELLRDVSRIALILSSDTVPHMNDPIQFSDKVKLITVSVLCSLHLITAEKDFDAFCFN